MLHPETKWAYRFHRDEKSWIRDPMVFVDMGREMPQGEPPLLKTRQHIHKQKTKEKWVSLISPVGKELIRFGVLPLNLEVSQEAESGGLGSSERFDQG